ncbi:hypothetical protein GCM10023093_01400 [Nemorincola caseinilytica]|uniref:Uncharacterized protein n=1 Tax=Nemorincola caseinilytica TaxID=2054315 RepID=A0ABP8N1P8_9BACT
MEETTPARHIVPSNAVPPTVAIIGNEGDALLEDEQEENSDNAVMKSAARAKENFFM